MLLMVGSLPQVMQPGLPQVMTPRPPQVMVAKAKPTEVKAKQSPAPGEHSHRCSTCGTTWTHGDEMNGNRAAHTCPNCGHLEWQIYQRGPAVQIKASQYFSTPCPGGR